MTILILGGGGREHALCWALARDLDPEVDTVLAAPGNGGTLEVADNVRLACVGPEVVAFCAKYEVDTVVVGPEGPLAAGVVDALRGAGIRTFGPTRAAARLESSKTWAKEFMGRYGIPTAKFEVFSDAAGARAYIESAWTPAGLVVKADGLASGKGVVVCSTQEEAIGAVFSFMERRTLGDAGSTVLVEERLEGPEVSILAFTDGHTYRLLPPAQDHKALYDGGKGPNTGGMGAVCPTPLVDFATLGAIEAAVIKPAVAGLSAEGLDYRGILYAGIILTKDGPKVLEFNCRFGDPEAQVLIPGLRNLRELLEATAEGRLEDVKVEHDGKIRVCVVATAPGYPEEPAVGEAIEGLEEAIVMEGVTIFHAGSALDADRGFVTRSGRVLGVTAEGSDLAEAQDRVYKAIHRISFGGGGPHFRHDIGVSSLVGVL